MTALKLIGAVILLAVGVLCAVFSVRFEKKRIRILDGWIDLIQYIRAKIDCYLMPLGEILSAADRPLASLCELETAETDLSAILRASRAFLDGETLRLLSGFVRELGTTYREEQLHRCDYYLTALRLQRERLCESLPTRSRLHVTLCLCLSIGAAVLLW